MSIVLKDCTTRIEGTAVKGKAVHVSCSWLPPQCLCEQVALQMTIQVFALGKVLLQCACQPSGYATTCQDVCTIRSKGMNVDRLK